MNERESIRWRMHDYRSAGAYFVTACAQDRDPLFGEVRDGEMMFNEAGRAVCAVWREIPARFRGVTLDEWILMPDHFHGLVVISELRRRRTTWPTLGEVVAAFKSRSTVEYIRGVRLDGWKPFRGRLWQRNYFERVVRDQTEMDLARAYIRTNPQRHAQIATIRPLGTALS